MPRQPSANVAHAAITDHRILRRADVSNAAGNSKSGVQPDPFSLIDFHRELHSPNDPEHVRDLALALIYRAAAESRKEVRQVFCQRALPLVDEAVLADPGDIDILEAQSLALWALDMPNEALAIAEAILAKVPERERSRELAARIAAQLGKVETAIEHWRRLLSANPWNPVNHYLLARLLHQRQDWAGAMQEASAALGLDPSQIESRMMLVAGYFNRGDKSRARQEFKVIERLQPPDLGSYRAWVKQQDH
jgi:tetratricopeptide (TPR) repeat protein